MLSFSLDDLLFGVFGFVAITLYTKVVRFSFNHSAERIRLRLARCGGQASADK
jgi:hypothetical protein